MIGRRGNRILFSKRIGYNDFAYIWLDVSNPEQPYFTDDFYFPASTGWVKSACQLVGSQFWCTGKEDTTSSAHFTLEVFDLDNYDEFFHPTLNRTVRTPRPIAKYREPRFWQVFYTQVSVNTEEMIFNADSVPVFWNGSHQSITYHRILKRITQP